MVFKLFSRIIVLSVFVVLLFGFNAFGGRLSGPGNKLRGMELFTGKLHLKNGGAACIACHSINSIKTVGGSLGPNLTSAYKQLGQGLDIVLKSVPFPTMKPIYQNRPITDSERADLVAFLKYSSTSGTDKNEGAEFFIYAVAVLAVLIILVPIIWRNRLYEVRSGLIKKA